MAEKDIEAKYGARRCKGRQLQLQDMQDWPEIKPRPKKRARSRAPQPPEPVADVDADAHRDSAEAPRVDNDLDVLALLNSSSNSDTDTKCSHAGDRPGSAVSAAGAFTSSGSSSNSSSSSSSSSSSFSASLVQPAGSQDKPAPGREVAAANGKAKAQPKTRSKQYDCSEAWGDHLLTPVGLVGQAPQRWQIRCGFPGHNTGKACAKKHSIIFGGEAAVLHCLKYWASLGSDCSDHTEHQTVRDTMVFPAWKPREAELQSST